MNELQIILEALQFLLGQKTNEVDPAVAHIAVRHLGNVKSLASKVLAPVEAAVAEVAASVGAPGAAGTSVPAGIENAAK